MDMNRQQITRLHQVIEQAGQIILGKQTAIKLALTCLLARGHLIIEDLPGMGKTTLAHVIAQLLGLDFSRIQFTSDMLPADVLGVSIYEQTNHRFVFHPGPIFANVVLADEINRSTPKTQSALLEAMEERQITIEGETRSLPDPFFVIATQNPAEQIGTYALPESQLDRFLMSISLGYPDAESERKLLAATDRRDELLKLTPCISHGELTLLQQQVKQITATDDLFDYIQAILNYTRQSEQFVCGLSPRAGLALLNAARAWAMLDDRDHVIPEDIQVVLPHITGHRLQQVEFNAEQSVAEKLLAIPIP
ncbi:MAG: MoxR family ATPase [Gammaproteobacteria bacterium]|nr:MoxR family ATPase [Gammaproteobacteria bacterium]MDH5650284.1 MoxR family ATPase [Gammaproteobacteria bacterium]